MSTRLWLLLAPIFLAHSYLVWRRLLAYLRYFQQEGYEHVRFLAWTGVRSLTDPAFWLAIGCALIVGPSVSSGAISASGATGASSATGGEMPDLTVAPAITVAIVSTTIVFVSAAILLGLAQPDPRRSGKVPLKLTWRAMRVLGVAYGVASVTWLILALASSQAPVRSALIVSAIVFAIAPLILIAANTCSMPYERHVQRSYEADAVQRVNDVRPFIIGITGSYGKSSAKSMLAHILQYKAPTLAASGSINTLMGVTRHIREELVSGHRFMVVEMGAFKTGSIRRLCALTPPSAGLITAVGDMHLERFGSTEEIIRAKSELASAVPPGGLVVVNADSPGALRIARGAAERRVLLYGETSTENLDTRLEQVTFSARGTTFMLRTRERTWTCFTPLLGRPIVLNLAGAFTLAAAVGVDPELIVASFRALKPVSNRLEVVEENGITWIRDAYNSNQFGFRAALEVVAALPSERRFLATPGVIELGPQQFDVNRALSRAAAEVCDRTLVVAETNREAFVAGHREAGREDRLLPVSGRTAAFRWLNENLKSGDAVILENDLPDLYEKSAGVFWKAS